MVVITQKSSGSLRYAIVGTGMMGLEHIHALQALPDTDIVALCDPHAHSVDVARSHLVNPEVATYTDIDAMIRDATFDVAIVATPNFTHHGIVKKLLTTDAHLLIEKPLCITTAECQDIVDIAQQSNRPQRVVWVGLEYRYMAPTARLLQLADGGSLGPLRMLAIREHRFPFLVKVGDWNRFNANTGGTLVEKCCHFFDLMRLILRSEPVRVFASGAQDVNHLHEEYEGRRPDILDNAFVIVDFASGARASLDLCMFAEATKNEQEISLVGDLGKAEALVTQATVRVGYRKDGWFTTNEESVVTHDVPREVLAHGAHHGSSWREHVAMQRAIRSGQTADVALHDGLMSVAMGEAAQRSIALGRPVALAEVLG